MKTRMVNFILGAAGSGKTSRAAQKISEAYAKGLSVLILVPDQFTFDYSNRLYRELGPETFNMIEVNSFERMGAELVKATRPDTLRSASALSRQTVMYLTLLELSENKGIEHYASQARRPDFITGCLDVIKELRISSITPEMLMQACENGSERFRERMNELANVYAAYERKLYEYELDDGYTKLTEAAQSVSLAGMYGNSCIFVDEFKSFTADELKMLESLIKIAPEVNICLTTDGETDSVFSPFHVVNLTRFEIEGICERCAVPFESELLHRQVRFKNAGLESLSCKVFAPTAEPQPTFDGSVRVFAGTDIYEETRMVCAEIHRLAAEEKIDYGKIAIILRNEESYRSIIESTASMYGIPLYFDSDLSVMHTSVAIFVSSVLSLCASGRYETHRILNILKSGCTDVPLDDVYKLEKYCYKWKIDGAVWTSEFQYCDESDERIRRFIVEPIEAFRENTVGMTGSYITREFYKLLTLLGIERMLQKISENIDNEDARLLEYVRNITYLWEQIVSLLDQVYICTDSAELTLKQYNDIFQLGLKTVSAARTPYSLSSVSVTAAQRGRLSEPEITFVMGALDGVLPYAAKSRGLLSDNDLDLLKHSGISIFDDTKYKISEERYIAYSTISSASRCVYSTYPTTSENGTETRRSSLIDKILAIFPDVSPLESTSCTVDFYCSTPLSAYTHYVRNLRNATSDNVSLSAALHKIKGFSQRLEVLSKSRNEHFHLSDSSLLNELTGGCLTLSPSRFEEYQKCPFSFFCRKCLSVMQNDAVEVNPAQSGSAIHFCLEQLLRDHPRDVFVGLSSDEIRQKIRQYMDSYRNESMGGSYSKTVRFDYLYDMMERNLVNVASQMQTELAQSAFIPTDFELRIGSRDVPSLDINAEENALKVRVSGIVDRADVCETAGERYLRIVDYKSGGKDFAPADLLYGLNMQMLIYLFALTQKGGKYDGYVPAGVLYMPAVDLPPQCGRGSDDAEVAASLEKGYKMKGVLLDDETSVAAMEAGCSGRFIPVKKKKDGTFDSRSKVISARQMDNIRSWTENIIGEMSRKLSSGDVSASPLFDGKIGPCSYCDYGEICGSTREKRMRSRKDEQEFISQLSK